MSNNKLIYWSITVGLAGFLFGFDTIVISGADQPVQALWGDNYPCLGFLDTLFPFADCKDSFHSFFIMSMALWGTLVGALFGGIPCNIFGRKTTLFWIGVLYAISAIGSGLATDPYMFSIFRFIGGVGVGASSVAAPIYISEIAPSHKRGQLVAIYQFNIVFGILVAFFSNYFIGQYLSPDVSWRWMLGIEGLPAIIYTFMVLGVPNSPRWLILKKNAVEKASVLLARLNPNIPTEEQVAAIKASVGEQTANSGFFSKKYSTPLMLAFMLAFFNQASGINFVLYYAPRIFSQAGIQDTLLASLPIGIVNLVFTFVGMYLIDKLGRKQLMIIGSIGYITMLLGVAWAFYTEASAGAFIFFICAFVGAHAIGQGAVIWVFISEIFPNKVRDYGMSFGSGTHWLFAAIITFITLPILNAFPTHYIFIGLSVMMMFQLVWVLLIMPETKGVPLEELERKLIK